MPGWTAAAGLALFPVVQLLSTTIANVMFTLLVLWGLFCMAVFVAGKAALWRFYWRRTRLLILAMCLWPLSIAIHDLAAGQPLHIPYLFLRFALFGIIAWGLVQWRPILLQQIQWGFVGGAMMAAVWLSVVMAGDLRPQHVGTYNIIPFSNLALLMGVLSALSVGWTPSGGSKVGVALKWLGGGAGLYGSYVSLTRGGWIAIPVLLVFVLACARQWPARFRLAVFVLFMAGAGLAGVYNDGVRDRVIESVHNLWGIERGQDLDSSEGGRVQVWEASLRILKAHPLVGVGVRGFQEALHEQLEQGLVTPTASELPHSHNEVLFAGVMLGVFGIVSVLSIYVVLGVYFLGHVRNRDATIRFAAAMGLASIIAFVMYGLTEVMFGTVMVNAFFVVLMATLVAIIVGREAELEPPSSAG